MRIMTLSGRVVSDAVKKTTQSGREYIHFRMANNEFGDAKDEQGNPITYWFSVTCFTTQGMNIQKYLTKGRPINVIGEYSDNVYPNKITGNCEVGRNIRAEMIYFSESSNRNNDGNGNQTSQAAPVSASKQTSEVEIPKTQTKMLTPEQQAAVANSGLKIPLVNGDSDDDLPF